VHDGEPIFEKLAHSESSSKLNFSSAVFGIGSRMRALYRRTRNLFHLFSGEAGHKRTILYLRMLKIPFILTNSLGISILARYDDENLKNKLKTSPNVFAHLKQISKILSEGNVVFDVGANVGMYSVWMSRCVGEHGCVYVFEPIRQTYFDLLTTIGINKCGNIKAFNMGFFNKNGKLTMNVFDKGYSGWSTVGEPIMYFKGEVRRPVSKEVVEMTTLDNFVEREGIDTIDFLKVDVEGAEEFVFQGASKLLQQKRVKLIGFEISKAPLDGVGSSARRVIKTLRDFGYYTYEYREDSNGAALFENPIEDTDLEYVNIYAKP